jgi:multimeric flavodoxin WrbA
MNMRLLYRTHLGCIGILLKVLGIVGGAKSEGNTVKLVEEVLAGAREAGHETVLFKLGELEIGHLGEKDGETTFPIDDFEKIKPHIESMGALVLGAPIWYSTVDSRTHTFIQRLYWYSGYYSEENKAKWPKGAKAINCITYGWDKPHVYDEVLDWMKEIEKSYGMKKIKGFAAANTGEKPVENRKNLLKRAHEAGSKL